MWFMNGSEDPVSWKITLACFNFVFLEEIREEKEKMQTKNNFHVEWPRKSMWN